SRLWFARAAADGQPLGHHGKSRRESRHPASPRLQHLDPPIHPRGSPSGAPRVSTPNMPDPYEHLDAGILAERRGALDEALQHYHAAAETDDPWLRSDALRRQASVHRNRAEWDEALKLARSAAEVAAAASLLNQEAEARNAEALVYIARGEFEAAITALERVLASCQDARIRGVALQN